MGVSYTPPILSHDLPLAMKPVFNDHVVRRRPAVGAIVCQPPSYTSCHRPSAEPVVGTHLDTLRTLQRPPHKICVGWLVDGS